MTELKLEITQADIDAGYHDGGDCPVACALRRVCSLPFHVTAKDLVFYYSHDRSWQCRDGEIEQRKQVGSIVLPPELQQFIRDYDAERKVFPFTFVWKSDLFSVYCK